MRICAFAYIGFATPDRVHSSDRRVLVLSRYGRLFSHSTDGSKYDPRDIPLRSVSLGYCAGQAVFKYGSAACCAYYSELNRCLYVQTCWQSQHISMLISTPCTGYVSLPDCAHLKCELFPHVVCQCICQTQTEYKGYSCWGRRH